MQLRGSALVDRPAELLFDRIEAAAHYPQFLPWCTGAAIVARDEQWVSADLRLRVGGVAFAPEVEFDSPWLTRIAGGLAENA